MRNPSPTTEDRRTTPAGQRVAWAMAIGMTAVIGIIVLAADLGLPLPLRRMLAVPLVDKLGHFGLFGALSWLVVRAATESWPRKRPGRVGAACAVILLAVSAIEEYSQNYIGARTFSLWDLGASSLGIVLMAVAAARFAEAGSKDAVPGITGKRA